MAIPIEYTLIASDGIECKISAKAAAQSITLSDMIGCLNIAGQKEPLPISNVAGDVLRRIVEWCEKHKDDYCAPPRAANRGEPIPKWDVEWLRVDGETLYDLVCGANFLNVPRLLDYACKTVADMASGKDPEELRRIYGILSDEEEERMAQESRGELEEPPAKK